MLNDGSFLEFNKKEFDNLIEHLILECTDDIYANDVLMKKLNLSKGNVIDITNKVTSTAKRRDYITITKYTDGVTYELTKLGMDIKAAGGFLRFNILNFFKNLVSGMWKFILVVIASFIGSILLLYYPQILKLLHIK